VAQGKTRGSLAAPPLAPAYSAQFVEPDTLLVKPTSAGLPAITLLRSRPPANLPEPAQAKTIALSDGGTLTRDQERA
jgi:hypothetical protein